MGPLMEKPWAWTRHHKTKTWAQVLGHNIRQSLKTGVLLSRPRTLSGTVGWGRRSFNTPRAILGLPTPCGTTSRETRISAMLGFHCGMADLTRLRFTRG